MFIGLDEVLEAVLLDRPGIAAGLRRAVCYFRDFFIESHTCLWFWWAQKKDGCIEGIGSYTAVLVLHYFAIPTGRSRKANPSFSKSVKAITGSYTTWHSMQ